MGEGAPASLETPPSGGRHPLPGEPGFVDRRKRPTPMLSRYTFFGGRRGACEAAGRHQDTYVDVYSSRQALLVLVFFGLTIFDAAATIYYIDHVRGTEWNPIAQWLLNQGNVLFLLGKGMPTGLLLLFVMIHKNFRYGKFALGVGFTFYFLLTLYHLLLQAMALRIALGGNPIL
jgi:hypothetical protein